MDLRSFINRLEDAGDLIRIKKEVSPVFEVAAISNKISKELGKAVLFERVKGHSMPVVGQVLGSYGRLATYLNLNKENFVSGLSRRWGMEKVSLQDKGVVQRSITETFDLTKDFPLVTHSEKDAGPYITGGVTLVKDPYSDVQNMSYHRMQLIGPRETRIRIADGHHLWTYVDRAEREGRNLEAAILIGASPAVMFAAAASLALDEDELELAGALVGKPIKVMKAESCDLLVPIDTEIIVEGEILANDRRSEGPFGDWMGNYIPLSDNHVFIPKIVSTRREPLFYDMIPGSPEDVVLLGFSTALSVFRDVQKVVPTVVDVACWPFPFHVVVKIRKQFEGQGKQAALAALGSNMHWIKYCTVVDEDIDIYSPRDVAWAMTSRCCPDRDIFRIPNTPSYYRDPHRMHWGRLVVDATAPLCNREEYERTHIPGESELDLNQFI